MERVELALICSPFLALIIIIHDVHTPIISQQACLQSDTQLPVIVVESQSRAYDLEVASPTEYLEWLTCLRFEVSSIGALVRLQTS